MKTRKELKNKYKQMELPMGVFQVRNIINNRVLIDSSTDMPSKWNRHKMELRFGDHRNHALQKDWNGNGENSFVFEILSELKRENKEDINYRKGLQALQEMVIEELNLDEGSRY